MNLELVYKLLPILSGVLGFLFGVVCYLVERYSISYHTHVVYWAMLFTAQTVAGFFLGLFIKRLYYAAFTDSLTGVRNHRYFYSILNRQLRQSSTLCLVYLDLDNFKCINDTSGHHAGDNALLKFTAILRQNCRETDTVARLGGDEFVLLLPDTKLEGAFVVAERIRQQSAAELAPFQATISAGVVASWPEATADRLMSLADRALYQAKTGKNRVVHLTHTEEAATCS